MTDAPDLTAAQTIANLASELARVRAAATHAHDALVAAADYFAERSDAEILYDGPLANAEMRRELDINQAIEKLEREGIK